MLKKNTRNIFSLILIAGIIVGTQNSCKKDYQCTNLDANFGDTCTDSNGNPSTISSDCDCQLVYDCSNGINIDDTCIDNNGNTSTVLSDCSCSPVVGELLIDARDGQEYPTVLIGDRRWMAENLNIGLRINSTRIESDDLTDDLCKGDIHPDNLTDNNVIEKYCYDNNPSNCQIYGGLYQWNELMAYDVSSNKGICPEGWHVPTDEEWKHLEMTLGMSQTEADKGAQGRGTNQGYKILNAQYCSEVSVCGSSNFNALIGGYRSSSGGYFYNIESTFSTQSHFWTSTSTSDCNAIYRSTAIGPKINRHSFTKFVARSCRCIEDE